MQVDLTDFQNVKVIATIDQTFYRNVGAIILYEEDSHTLSVRKLTRKTVDHFIPTDELEHFTFASHADAIKFTHKLTRMSALDYLLVAHKERPIQS
ncbi:MULTISPECIES: hypothetical protein [Bacteria]|uniref:Uncharacterized protein n=1 Tax=Lysinibacillus fusiformis TaxID=28031 RepID=A0A1H9SA64_9BACI|nr:MULTISPECIES: hypothetical protein [Lysinibacillus]EAZ84968.1 hypothetical protein BB14905_00020 [Bacillus sp. B14905]MCG7437611.1 hypothetical protein [Lysinibacillus fusiformis]MED4077798.1 hypothetical protein [Lysinibacillus fusiformis]MED4671601.1 hypothetical protein [Lysinibacillus fusiformis]NOG26778.1 hypothetical protein [Lysinibacillus fusiformis]